MMGRAGIITITVNGFCAPVAFERAAAGGADVQRKIAVMVQPYLPVAFDVYEVPGGQRKGVEVLHYFPCTAADGQPVLYPGQPFNGMEIVMAIADGVYQLQQGLISFTEEHEICPL